MLIFYHERLLKSRDPRYYYCGLPRTHNRQRGVSFNQINILHLAKEENISSSLSFLRKKILIFSLHLLRSSIGIFGPHLYFMSFITSKFDPRQSLVARQRRNLVGDFGQNLFFPSKKNIFAIEGGNIKRHLYVSTHRRPKKERENPDNDAWKLFIFCRSFVYLYKKNFSLAP